MNKYKKYLDYIKNCGGSVNDKDFDEDWEPIGPQIRHEMTMSAHIWQEDGVIFLNNNPDTDL